MGFNDYAVSFGDYLHCADLIYSVNVPKQESCTYINTSRISEFMHNSEWEKYHDNKICTKTKNG